MINILIKHQQFRRYTESTNSIVVGRAFYQGGLYQGEDFAKLVSTWCTTEQFLAAIGGLNGFYALIHHQGTQLFAAVDRVRSIPLFYGQKGKDFYLSDSAEWIRQQVGNQDVDPLAKDEFLLTGYVTGPDTLYPDVKQLQAGEAIMVGETEQGIVLKPIRYYRFRHEYTADIGMEGLMEKHDQVLVRIFNRLIQVAGGRTIVVPLSGGYDSRLIVLMLKRLGYEKVVTFSYGRLGNSESEVSRQVAQSLGLRWEFIEYSNDLWHKWYHSAEYKKYTEFADGLSSLPHCQDWPAVWQLQSNNTIPKSSIFVPGHSADLPAGSRSKAIPEIYVQKDVDVAQLLEVVLDFHFSLVDWTCRRDVLKPALEERIIRSLGIIKEYPDNSSAFESWDIAERQAKFIINSVRVYDFWHYAWWIPFWDYEYELFWAGVNTKYRFRKVLYDAYILDLEKRIAGHYLYSDSTESIKSRIRGTRFENLAKKLYRGILQRPNLEKSYESHPLAFYGMVDKTLFKKLFPKAKNINSFLAHDYFKK